MDLEEEARKLFISEEIKNTRTEPYWTVIRHFFEKM